MYVYKAIPKPMWTYGMQFCTSVGAEYVQAKGSPNANRRNAPLQPSIQRSPQLTPKRPSSEPHGATGQQAIAKAPTKRLAYLIPSVIVIFVVLVRKVYFVSLIPESHS
jgi:hypothetical protein